MNKLAKKSINERLVNSKFSFTKNFLYFLIFPLLVLIVGIILVSTVGFNLGVDFGKGTTFKLCVNYGDAEIENATNYDIDNQKDYSTVCGKIRTILNDEGLSIVSFRKTKMNIYEYGLTEGYQAVEVTYSNVAKSNDELKQKLLDEFGYQGYDKMITSFDKLNSRYSFDFIIGIVASIVFALLIAIIYMSARYNLSAMFVCLLQVALDIFMTIGLILVTRVTVNLSIGAVLLSTFLFSLFNLIYFYMKVKEGFKNGEYEGMKKNEIADKLTKKITANKTVVYIALLCISLLLIPFVDVAVGLILSLITTFYTSQFILPTLWSTMYVSKKKMKVNKEKDALN